MRAHTKCSLNAHAMQSCPISPCQAHYYYYYYNYYYIYTCCPPALRLWHHLKYCQYRMCCGLLFRTFWYFIYLKLVKSNSKWCKRLSQGRYNNIMFRTTTITVFFSRLASSHLGIDFKVTNLQDKSFSLLFSSWATNVHKLCFGYSNKRILTVSC